MKSHGAALAPGAIIEVTPTQPVAGGRMLARLSGGAGEPGQVVLVAGAIPGERVRARVERRQKSVLFAHCVDVLDASPDRRPPACDPRCGGSAFAHIRYTRQLVLKSEIVADAFARIAKHPLAAPLVVRPSREDGYRMRARVHVQDGRWGFLVEGTHTLCDAAPTRQLSADTVAALNGFAAAHPDVMAAIASITVSENAAGTARALVLEPRAGVEDVPQVPDPPAGIDGIEVPGHWGSGVEWLEDHGRDVWPDGAPMAAPIVWRRRATSFFQGNRYLVGDLVRAVTAATGAAAHAVDLYAGGGLFSVALAAAGTRVTAVESDPSGVADLRDNALSFADLLTPVASTVEGFVASHANGRTPAPASAPRPDVVVMDPPRVGASPEAVAGIIALAPPRIVYVSCDAPTLARDCAKFFAAGYTLTSIQAFDMFPNTAHVEVVAQLDVVRDRPTV